MITVESAWSDYHGHSVKFGCLRPVVPIRRMFRRYLTAVALPPPPDAVDFSPLALAVLTLMLGNSMVGNCVQAGFGHHKGVWTGNVGKLFVETDAQAIADYSAITGYVPGDPNTDRGTDPVAAYQWWAANPSANGSKLAGAMGFDAANANTTAGQYTLKQALDIFEGVQVTLQLPDAYTNPLPSAPGFVWDVAGPPDPSQGHCYLAYGYDDAGLKIVPWGGLYGTMTWDAVATYCTAAAGGMIYILLDPDQVGDAALKAGNGLDWFMLAEDFPVLQGTSIVVPVSVSPTPVPGPAPVPVVNPPAPKPAPTPVPVPAATTLTLSWDSVKGQMVLPAGYAHSAQFGPTIVVHPRDKRVMVPAGYTVVAKIT